MFQIYGVLDLIFLILGIGAFILSTWALVHAIKTPARAFAVTGKQSKQVWLLILGFATLFSFAGAVGYLNSIGFLVIISVVAAGVYLADVRPAVREVGKGGNSGPYGPW
ncbi:DUF2516 family protein [Planomonospora sp. ID82291]|uniref:DUF2516 family protein n=1 Tax=Planomonospora sp. ID82291 TaxID=2738136 RepID=UPI0018C361C5|nr:DUF2516 family protein [Planomonospora sp. ID82291]MBG0813749.1 DUF2516 family protein [Planomonospora sp. ID82291]